MAVFDILKNMNSPDVTRGAYKNKKNYKQRTAHISTVATPLHNGGV